MLTNNYSFNSPGKQIQRETIVNDEKFINLINNLSELIKNYYYTCKSTNDEIIQSFTQYKKNTNYLLSIIKDIFGATPPSGPGDFFKVESNIKTIEPEFQENFQKNREGLKFFIEEAKEIFKQMKYRRYEKINYNNMNKDSNKLIKKKYDYSTNVKHKNSMETFRINDIRTSSKLRLKEDNNILNNNTFNSNTYNYYNTSSLTNNLDNIKYLFKKFSEYNNLIGNISLKAKDNFVKLQNDINIELEKCSNNNHRKSFIYHNNDSSENSFINNYSFNIMNKSDKFCVMKKTLFRDFSSNKTRTKNNINNFNDESSYDALKSKNFFYKNQIKHLEFQIEDFKSTINVLEKSLYDSNNQLNKLSKDIKNSNDINHTIDKDNNFSNSLNNVSINTYNDLKKKNNNLLQKLKINEIQMDKSNKEIKSLKQDIIMYKLKNDESNSELNKLREYTLKLENEIKEIKLNPNNHYKVKVEEKKDNTEDNKNANTNINMNINSKDDNTEKINYLKIIEENKKDILLKEKNISLLNEKINIQNKDYETKLKNLNEKNSKVIIEKQKEIENLINKNLSLNNEINNLKGIIDTNSQKENDRIKEYKEKITNNDKLVENLNELLDKEKKDNKGKIDTINNFKKEIDDLKKEKERNNILIEDNNKIINDLKEEKIKLTNQNTELKRNISLNEDNNKIIKDLKEEKIELNNVINSLKNKLSILEEEKTNGEKENEFNINNKNEEISKLKNELEEKEKYTNELKDRVMNLESQYDKLKLNEDNIITENESLTKELNLYKNKCDKLQIDFNLKNYNLTKELNELKKKSNAINEETEQINELKLEKEKIIKKILEYKDIEESNNQQIKLLKERIKELEKKLNNNLSKNDDDKYEGNDDAIEEYNKMRILYEEQVNKNKELENKIHYKDEQIEGLKIVVNKFADEKISFNEKKKSSHSSININNINNINNRYNNYDYENEDEKSINNEQNIKKDLKEAKIIINKLNEEKTKLENEIKNLKDNNKLLRSEYKSEGGIEVSREGNEEEEYTMKKMVNGAKKRNQSEDIKIDYPGLSNMKQ